MPPISISPTAAEGCGYTATEAQEIAAQGELWVCDGNGGIFQEPNGAINASMWAYIAGQIASDVQAPWGTARSQPLCTTSLGVGIWSVVSQQTNDPQLAAYFIDEANAYQWQEQQQKAGALTVTTGNRVQESIQGAGEVFSDIGNDFASGNIGGGLAGIGGLIVDTIPAVGATGAGTSLLQDAGATSGAAAVAAGLGQAADNFVNQAGQAAQGVANGKGLNLSGVVGALPQAPPAKPAALPSSEQIGAPAPAASSAPASSGLAALFARFKLPLLAAAGGLALLVVL